MKTLSLVHVTRKPLVEQDTPPLLLLLHGFGSNEHDLISMAPSLDERFLIISMRAPNTLSPGSYAWFDVDFRPQGSLINAEQAEASRQILLNFISEAVPAYGADASRVYLMGFSQGAIMSASIALTQPALIAGAVLMSGRVLPEIVPLTVPAEQLKGFPILIVHGKFDDVLPIQNARDSHQLLSSLPVELTYKEYAMGHEVTRESLDDVARWLSDRLECEERIKIGS